MESLAGDFQRKQKRNKRGKLKKLTSVIATMLGILLRKSCMITLFQLYQDDCETTIPSWEKISNCKVWPDFDFAKWATKPFNMERNEELCVLLYLETSSRIHMCVLHYSAYLQVFIYLQEIQLFLRSPLVNQIWNQASWRHGDQVPWPCRDLEQWGQSCLKRSDFPPWFLCKHDCQKMVGSG